MIGDGAGLLNLPKIKGTHQALRSGMLAAVHIAGQGSAAGFDGDDNGSVLDSGAAGLYTTQTTPGASGDGWWPLMNTAGRVLSIPLWA